MKANNSPKKFTIIGDPHVQPNNLNKIEKLFNQIELMGNDAIVLGDTFHTKEVIRGKCLNLVYERIKNSKLQWIVLVGNHCWFDAEGTDHALQVFKDLKNVLVVDTLTVKYSRDTRMLLLPWLPNDKFREQLVKAKSMMTNDHYRTVLFIHQGVNNFDFGNGVVESSGIDLEELEDFDLVVSGHFHKRQEEDNLIYVGTPFSHSFGESNQQKYLLTLDTVDLELNWIETSFPRHITKTVKCPLVSKPVINSGRDYLRVILTGAQKDIDAFPKKNYPGVKFIERPDEEDIQLDIREDQSAAQQFKQWAAKKQLDKKVVKEGLEILSSV